MLPNKSRLPARLWVVFVSSMIMFSLAGCGTFAAPPPPEPVPCPVDGKQLYSGNAYPELQDKAAKEITDKIRDFTLQNISDTAKVAMAKREALKLLENQAKRWSDVQYISLENEPNIRVIVSFISPGLIRAVVLNQWLHYLSTTPPPPSLDEITNNSLKIFDAKNEFAFILLVQSEQQPARLFSVSPNGILLHNTTGLKVKSQQSDYFLNMSLNSSEKTHSGFFFYQSGVLDGQTCLPLLETNRDTSLILEIESATVGDKKTEGPVIWRIYFPPLGQLNSSLFVPDLSNYVQNGEDGYESPLSEPPSVSTFDPANDDNTIVWRDVGRFIWWKLTMDHTP